MDTQETNSKNDLTGDEKVQSNRKDWRNFIIVMVVFTIGMIGMLIADVSAWWIWYLYFAVWTILELRIAKNIHLKWWHWVLIIIGILLVDFIAIELFG